MFFLVVGDEQRRSTNSDCCGTATAAIPAPGESHVAAAGIVLLRNADLGYTEPAIRRAFLSIALPRQCSDTMDCVNSIIAPGNALCSKKHTPSGYRLTSRFLKLYEL